VRPVAGRERWAGPGSTPGASVTFDGSGSYDPDGTIQSYAWNFGDGTTGSGATATHTYVAPGTYTATLTVTDNSGAQGSDTAQVSVTVSATGGPHIRSQRFGGRLGDAAYSAAIDVLGNVVITGEFFDQASFGGTTLRIHDSVRLLIGSVPACARRHNAMAIWFATATRDNAPINNVHNMIPTLGFACF